MFVGDAVFCKERVHLVDEAGEEALGFCHRQRAGGQRHACHAVFPLFAGFWVNQPVFARDGLDAFFIAWRHAGDDEVLVGGQAEVAFVDFRDFAQAGFELFAARLVGDAAVFDE